MSVREKFIIEYRGVEKVERQAVRGGRRKDSNRRRGRRLRDVKLRHGPPGLATGDCHLQGDLGNTHMHTHTYRKKGERCQGVGIHV